MPGVRLRKLKSTGGSESALAVTPVASFLRVILAAGTLAWLVS